MLRRCVGASVLISMVIGVGCAPPNPAAAPPTRGRPAPIASSTKSAPAEADPNAEIPIVQAVRDDDTATVRDLLAKGADPNTKDKEGVPLLLMAIDKPTPDIARALLEKGAKMDIQDSEGETLLIHAVDNSNLPIATLLLDNHADPNQPDNAGDLPLNMAVTQGDLPLAKLLLERGADPNKPNKAGDSALKIATREKDTEFITLFGPNNTPAPPSQ